MNPRFNNKICIVTRAAQGIGQGVALALAAEGGTVVLANRSEFVHPPPRPSAAPAANASP